MRGNRWEAAAAGARVEAASDGVEASRSCARGGNQAGADKGVAPLEESGRVGAARARG